MPMLDYVCLKEECGEHIESFHFPSSIPDSIQCRCGGVMVITYEPTIAMRRPISNAQLFDPIVVHRRLNPDNNDYEYHYPARHDEPTPSGYERLEMNTMREVDRFTKGRGEVERELNQMGLAREKAHFDQQIKARREHSDSEMRRLGIRPSRLTEVMRRRIDQKRDKRYSLLMNKDMNFHNQAMSFDSSNRQEHRDQDTGWKGRR